ncbi:MAG TPA: hypothetical protein VJ867_04320 [Gemmatimonadaceae bacterium]|nr:hypothetical protein [Gemmatimonadaceae bacterium]
MRRTVICSLLVALASCQRGEEPLNLSGTWRLQFTGMQLGSVECDVTDMDVVFEHVGTSLAGLQTGTAHRVCRRNGVQIIDNVFQGNMIANGSVSGTTVTFTLAVVPGSTLAMNNIATGVVKGDSISGMAAWPDQQGSLSVHGGFSATRQ